jgi:hypothetical protein
VNCTYCSTPVEFNTAYRRVQGWAKRAPSSSSRRGGEDVSLREHLNEWCCLTCHERLRSGLSDNQEALGL